MNDGLPHYPRQRDRDDAASSAGLIVVFVLVLVLSLGFVAGCTFKALVS